MALTAQQRQRIGGLLDAAQGIGAAAGGIAYADLIQDRGQQYAEQMGTLAGQLQQDSAFKGYGVRTGMGDSSVGADGSLNVGVGPNAQYQQMASQSMANAAFDPAQREQEIYNRAMAMQQPQLDAQRAAGNAQEYAAGRGGVMGSQFGGSGEDAAMARAQAQAQNAASFQAMGQAQQEMMNQAQLGAQAQQMAYTPYQQQLAALQLGQGFGGQAQTGQLTGTGYVGQLGLGGVQTAVNADKAASELYGNIIAATMAGASGGESGGGWLADIFGF